jgi:hypothetical protein
LTIFAPATFACVDESVLTMVVRFFWRVGLGITNFVAKFTLKLTSQSRTTTIADHGRTRVVCCGLQICLDLKK